MAEAPPSAARTWEIASRWQELEGEARANLLRVAAVAGFYVIEAANFRAGGVELAFHRGMTAIAAAWLVCASAVHVTLRRRRFPAALKYLSTAADVLLLTAALLLADGPRSPLLAAYFVVLAVSALRFDLRLVRATTAACAAGYLVVLGNARWWRPALQVPRYWQALFLFSLVMTGVAAGQVIRRSRELAEDFARRLGAPLP